jgi:lipoprotein NlpD
MFESVTTPAAASSSSKPPSPASAGVTPVVTAPSKPVLPAVATTTSVVPVAGVKTPSPAVLPPPAPAQVVSTGPSRAVSGVTWRWPAQGSLIKRFQSGDAIPGIEIGGNAGDPVHAAADGVVVYSGNGLVGYGELVIIKHNDSFLSAYGHNSKRLVKEGQRVTAGQQIAEMGSTARPATNWSSRSARTATRSIRWVICRRAEAITATQVARIKAVGRINPATTRRPSPASRL